MPKNTEQANWRFCNKCHALWWNEGADRGKCPVDGGQHDGMRSWNFHLPADNSNPLP